MPFVVNADYHKAGISLREEILGPDHVSKALAAEDDLIEYHHLFGHECSYAQIWSRSTLTAQLRSMCVVGMLAAVSPRSGSFKAHVSGAMRNGASRREVRQVLATVSFYLGAGVGTDAIEAAREELGPDPARAGRKLPEAVSLTTLEARGAQLRRELFGAEAIDLSDGANAAYERLKTNYYFGVLWCDGDLDHKSRALIVLSILVAANRISQLKIYLRAAQRLGCTRQEVDEVFLTAAIYCGAPACEDGLAASREYFSEPAR